MQSHLLTMRKDVYAWDDAKLCIRNNSKYQENTENIKKIFKAQGLILLHDNLNVQCITIVEYSSLWDLMYRHIYVQELCTSCVHNTEMAICSHEVPHICPSLAANNLSIWPKMLWYLSVAEMSSLHNISLPANL